MGSWDFGRCIGVNIENGIPFNEVSLYTTSNLIFSTASPKGQDNDTIIPKRFDTSFLKHDLIWILTSDKCKATCCVRNRLSFPEVYCDPHW